MSEGINKEGTSGPLARIVGIITSPTETFREIASKPSFVAPLIVIIGFFIIFALVYTSKTDMAEMMRIQLEKSGRLDQIPLDQQEAVLSKAAKIGSYSMVIGGAIAIPLVFVVVAAVLHLVGTLANAETNFKRVFSVTTYSFIPGIFHSILGTLLLLLKRINTTSIESLVKSNLGAMLGYELGKGALSKALYSVDLFTIWSLVLLGIGYSQVSKFSTKRSIIIVFALWALWIFVRVTLGGVFGG